MSTQPNPELWARFVEAVKAGRIDGLEVDGNIVVMSYGDFQVWIGEVSLEHRGVYLSSVDNLCAELRRWMQGKKYNVVDCFSDNGLLLYEIVVVHNPPYEPKTELLPPEEFNGSELDRHLAAALYVLEREGE